MLLSLPGMLPLLLSLQGWLAVLLIHSREVVLRLFLQLRLLLRLTEIVRMSFTHQKPDLTLFLRLKLLRSPHVVMMVLLGLSDNPAMRRKRSQFCRRQSQSKTLLSPLHRELPNLETMLLTQSRLIYLRLESRLKSRPHLLVLLRHLQPQMQQQ